MPLLDTDRRERQNGLIAGSASVGALAVGREGVGLIAGSPRPFISLIAPGNVGAPSSGAGALPSSIGAPPSSIGALPIGQGLGRGAGSSEPIISLIPRNSVIYSVPLSTGASFSFSNLYSTPFNSSQPAAPQAQIIMLMSVIVLGCCGKVTTNHWIVAANFSVLESRPEPHDYCGLAQRPEP